MIITITGLPGAGDLRRKMAEDRGMTIHEFNALGETEDFTDKDVDAYQEALGKEQDEFIIDGRLSWYFIPHSFKLFLSVDPKEAARRIFNDSKEGQRPNEDVYRSVEEVEEANAARLASDMKRYQKYYGVDYLKEGNYDLVIDTTDKSPEEILQLILSALDEKA